MNTNPSPGNAVTIPRDSKAPRSTTCGAIIALIVLHVALGWTIGMGLIRTILVEGSIPVDRLELAMVVSGAALLLCLGMAIVCVGRKSWWQARPGALLLLLAWPVAWFAAHNVILHAVCPRCPWVSKIGPDIVIEQGGKEIHQRWTRLHDSPQLMAGDDEGIWITDLQWNIVTRVDPQSLEILDEIAVGQAPVGVVLSEGSVWVANQGDGTVSRIDPTSNHVVATIPAGIGPLFLGAGAGSIWVTNRGDGTVSRIDPASNEVVATIHTGGGPSGMVISAGSVWVVNFDDDTVARVDPSKNQVVATVKLDRVGEFIAAAGSSIIVPLLDGSLAMIDSSREEVTRTQAFLGEPKGIAPGEDSVWIADRKRGEATQMDLHSGTVLLTVPVGKNPVDVAIAAGFVWIVNKGSCTVSRITP